MRDHREPGRGRGWPMAVDSILDGDLAVMLADVTPANGVVLTPLTNFALRDRTDGTVSVLTSLGAWRKLARMRRDPHVALVFHTRRHGYATGDRYLLVQGTASFALTPDRAWLESIEPNWQRSMGPRDIGLWERWTRVYQWERIGVEIAVERIVSWPDLECRGPLEVFGAPLSEVAPSPQRIPAKGVVARVNTARVTRRIARLPDTLLGWVGVDGFPFVVPVRHATATQHGITLDVACGLVPDGGRRAGLTSHWFTRGVLGQEQRVHTGWLQAEDGKVLYAPHTEAGYRMPPSKLLYRVVVGGMARYGLRKARRAGFLDPQSAPSALGT